MADLVVDTFDRADNTTTVGAGSVGPAPVVLAGTFGISANQLYPPALGSGVAVILWETGTANVDITVKRPSPTFAGSWAAILIGQDGSAAHTFWMAVYQPGSGTTYFCRVVAGVITYGWGAQGVSAAAVSTTTVLRLAHSNSIVQMWADTTKLLEVQVPEPITGTRHGLRTGVTSARWDDLRIADAAILAMPSRVGGTAGAAPVAAASGAPLEGFLYRGRDTKTMDTAGVA